MLNIFCFSLLTVYCGNLPYNPISEVCCQGSLVQITNPTQTQCCGDSALYNPQVAMCCGENVLPITSPNKRTCCFDLALYDNSTEQCCGGTVISKWQECCGSVGYSTGGCKTCVNGHLLENFNHKTHICCEDVLHELHFSHSCCCGSEVFDSTLKSCCNNNVIPKLPFDSSTCCRKLFYVITVNIGLQFVKTGSILIQYHENLKLSHLT